VPIFFQHDIDQHTRLAVWKIGEPESFFDVPLQRTITHPHKRLQHLAGRYLLRYLFPDFPLDLILVAGTRKPYLENEAYHFSISHCGDYAAVIVSQHKRVGIDIEIPTEKVLRIQHKFLHTEEAHMLNEWTAPSDVQKATVVWSAKEAMFKWWGRGEIDFSEVLRVQTEILGESGTFKAKFLKPGFATRFNVYYRLFPSLVLTWVATEGSSPASKRSLHAC
jgi:4'-phosphopantetheinyl transferase EntD